jgi:signal transduction histidine kinase
MAGFAAQSLVVIDPARGPAGPAAELDRQAVDLCFLDHRLGDWDGIDLLEADPTLARRLPVIALTGHHDDATAERALRAGAIDFLDKSDLGPSLIRRTVRYALHQHGTIRALRENRAVVLRNERKAILGSLAGGIAHEFNNLHAVILGNTELLSRRLQDQDARRYLTAVRDSLERAGEIISGMRRLAREEASGSCELASTWRSAVALSRSDIENAGVTMVSDEPPTVALAIDGGALMQVLLHLLANAIDALRGQEERLLTCEFSEGDDLAVITVADTGVGIDAEDLPMVTKPFFSRKGAHDRTGHFTSACPSSTAATPPTGSGLGLSVCERLVEEVGGVLRIASTSGVGTTVTVQLPRAAAHEASHTGLPTIPGSTMAEAQDLGLRVLVIDDQPMVREVVASWARQAGCSVLAVDHLQDVVRAVRDWRAQVLILDWLMPGIDGRQVIALLRSKGSLAAIHLIVYSGSPPAVQELAGLGFASVSTLRKPAAGESLTAALAGVGERLASRG